MTDKELRELDAWVFERLGILAAPTNPAAAMHVLEKCEDAGYGIAIKKTTQGHLVSRIFWNNFAIHETDLQFGETIPISICLFAKQLFSK